MFLHTGDLCEIKRLQTGGVPIFRSDQEPLLFSMALHVNDRQGRGYIREVLTGPLRFDRGGARVRKWEEADYGKTREDSRLGKRRNIQTPDAMRLLCFAVRWSIQCIYFSYIPIVLYFILFSLSQFLNFYNKMTACLSTNIYVLE